MRVKIDGYDPYSGVTIEQINIWETPDKREFYIHKGRLKSNIIRQVKHGKKVELLERQGDNCLIRYAGIVGFVKYWWVYELKADFIADCIEKTN